MQCVQSDCKVHVYTWDSFRENVYNYYNYNVIKMHRIGITITFEYFQNISICNYTLAQCRRYRV